MPSPEETVELVIAESGRLTEYLNTLPSKAWHTPSACDGWEICDVVAHLAYGGEVYAKWIERSLEGDASTPKSHPDAGTATAASFSESSAQNTISRRRQLGDQVLPAFIASSKLLNERLSMLGQEDWKRPHFFNSLGTATLRFRPQLRLFELVLHGWDIRFRLDSEVHLSPESLPSLLELLRGPLTRWIFRPGSRLPAPIRYRFELSGEKDNDTDIVVEGDTASIGPAGTAAANVTCQCDTETFVLMMSGRLLLSDALAQGRLMVEGETEQMDSFTQWFGGV